MIGLKDIERINNIHKNRSFKKIFNTILNKIEKENKNVHLFSKPVSITIETTNRCIFKCEMCPRSSDHIRKEGDMTISTFNKIKPLLKTAIYVNLSGFGETFLNEHFFEMLKIVKRYNCYVMVFSNGFLLNEGIIKNLIKYNLDEMVISVDGASSETYNNIRKFGSFDKLISNIKNLNHLKTSYNSDYPTLNLNFMGMKDNIHELPEVIKLAAKYNFKNVFAQNFAVFSSELEDQSLFNHQKYANKYINQAQEIANDLGIGFLIPSFEYNMTNCGDPFSSTYVTWDGLITTCAPQSFIIGDLRKSNVFEIWNSSGYKSLRKKFKNQEIPEQCKYCYCHLNTKEAYISYPQKLIKMRLEGRLRYDLEI